MSNVEAQSVLAICIHTLCTTCVVSACKWDVCTIICIANGDTIHNMDNSSASDF